MSIQPLQPLDEKYLLKSVVGLNAEQERLFRFLIEHINDQSVIINHLMGISKGAPSRIETPAPAAPQPPEEESRPSEEENGLSQTQAPAKKTAGKTRKKNADKG